MSQPRSDAAFLEDILVATRNALKFVRETTLEEFSADEKTNYAVIRAFEIIGEATKKVSSSFKESHPDMPWRFMAGMRDKLIHDYFGVDLEVVWRTAHEDLPSIESQLHRLLSNLQE